MNDVPAHRLSAAVRAAGPYLLPSLLLALLALLPVILGQETFVLRDVLNTHLMIKAPQAEALRHGELPLIDAFRGGGQPSLGNPNGLPFYPTNLLFLVGSDLWALNAHFWLHLFLAPWALYRLCRAWGLGRPAAWAGGVMYTFSGFFLSQLNFYNLITGAVWAPLFAALTLELRREGVGPRGGRLVGLGLVWALLNVAGDPLMALFALALAASVWFFAPRGEGLPPTAPSWRRSALVLGLALGGGTLLALPQWVEFGRIVGSSFRGFWGYGSQMGTIGSFHPGQVLELLLPQFFGRFDLLGPGSFWGNQFFEDQPPYFLSLYPGLLAYVLIAAAGWPRSRVVRWGWVLIGFGLFCSLGRYNPLMAPLLDLPLATSFRYPVKFWLFVAVGGAVLAALGFERLFPAREGGVPRLAPAARALGVLAALTAGFWLVLRVAPGPIAAWLVEHRGPGVPPIFTGPEMARWEGTLAILLALAAGLGLTLALAPRRPRLAGALLLVLSTASQLHLLRSLRPTDLSAPYAAAPPIVAALAPGERVVNGAYLEIFGKDELDISQFPDGRFLWLVRMAHLELWPYTGVRFGVPFDLNPSPEGLDSFLARIARDLVTQAPDDGQRVRLLRIWGLRQLLMMRPLTEHARESTRFVTSFPTVTRQIRLYEVVGALPEVSFAERIQWAPDVNSALRPLADPAFDPETTVILPGTGPPPAPLAAEAARGSVRVGTRTAERLELEVDAPEAGVVVIQRSHLPIYRATVDGAPVAVEAANLYRIGLRVPAGRHQVSLWLDRAPLHRAAWGSLAGLLLLLAAAWWQREPAAGEPAINSAAS